MLSVFFYRDVAVVRALEMACLRRLTGFGRTDRLRSVKLQGRIGSVEDFVDRLSKESFIVFSLHAEDTWNSLPNTQILYYTNDLGNSTAWISRS